VTNIPEPTQPLFRECLIKTFCKLGLEHTIQELDGSFLYDGFHKNGKICGIITYDSDRGQQSEIEIRLTSSMDGYDCERAAAEIHNLISRM